MASPNGTGSSNSNDRWAQFGFTTTPDERIGSGAPHTSPALQVNLFFRVFLGLVSIFVTWVPARLLWRGGEFGGTVLCVMLLVLNLITVVNALIWRDDNVERWWAGQGWCDILTYAFFAIHTAFNHCMFEIMRGLASKVALNRAVKPTRSERRRQRVISALVIFTVPVIQVVLTYFVTSGRYNVSTLVGCGAVYYPNWVFLVFYILPTPVFAVGAAYMAALAFYRYRKIEKATRDIARSQGGIAAARQDRVRKKLYFMTLFCIIVVLPLIMVLLFNNIVEGAPWSLPYDFDALHFGPDPFNVYFISFTTSDRMSFVDLNVAYIGEVAGIIVFIPFGTTPEALNMYREMLLSLGLGYVFPRLKEEYVPHATRGTGSWFSWSSLSRSLRSKSLLRTSSTSTRNGGLLPTTEQVSLASRSGRAHSSSVAQQEPSDFTMCELDPFPYPQGTVAASSTSQHNPWPDLSATEVDTTTAQIEAGLPPPTRDPFHILPTPYAMSPHPRFHTPSLSRAQTKGRRQQPSQPQPQTSGAATMTDFSNPSPSSSSSSSFFTPSRTTQDRDQYTTTFPIMTPAPTTAMASLPTTTSAATVGTSRTALALAQVDTRVWAADDHRHEHDDDAARNPLEQTGRAERAGKRERRRMWWRRKAGRENRDVSEGVVLVETRIARQSAELGPAGEEAEEGEGEVCRPAPTLSLAPAPAAPLPPAPAPAPAATDGDDN
ncbi:hypothetical protein L209DRAFT_801562 [Thermothelomyces heterothallicus CBS 203.75]